MVNETSTSKDALKERLVVVAEEIRRHYGISLYVVEIMGRRWSYMAGFAESGDGCLPPVRIPLNSRYGAIATQWDTLSPTERDAVINRLREAVQTSE